MRRHLSWLVWVAALAVMCVASDARAQRGRRAPTVAVVTEGPSDFYGAMVRKLAVEVEALLSARYQGFAFPNEPTHIGDYSAARATELVAEVLADDDVDLVVAFGLHLGSAVAKIEKLGKPVFLPFAIPAAQGLPIDGSRSGRKNLAYLAGHLDAKRELRRFREVIRRDRAVVVLDAHFWDAMVGIDRMIADAIPKGMDVRSVKAGSSAKEILAALPQDAGAVYIGPLLRMPASHIDALLDGINARRLPSYASRGPEWVKRGAFTTLAAADNDDRRVRRLALQIEETLSGTDPGKLRVTFEPKEALVINMATARRIGVYPSFELMTEARLIGQTAGDRGPQLSLRKAVEMALRAPDIAAARRNAQVAEEQIAQAEGTLYPSVTANAGFAWLDPDVASPLRSAERELSWGVSGRQLVYSPRALPGLDAARESRRSIGHGVRASELDVIRNAARAYVDLLRVRTAEQINRDNLLRIRRNLALAEARVEIGTAGRQEVFRWQIEIAEGRIAVIGSNADRNRAEIALNRQLNRGLEEPMQLMEPSAPDAGIVLDDRIRKFVDDPWTFRVFRRFMIDDAVAAAPEIKQFDSAIDAQVALRGGQKQALYVPEVALTGGITHTFLRAGTGGDDVAGMGRDDLTWQAGVGLMLPLFDMVRYAEIRESSETIAKLRDERSAAKLSIQQRILSAMHRAGASNAAVRLRKDAAAAAAANFELVADAYLEGAVDVITVVDAQNRALQTELAAANAVYDFVADVIEVERAAGRFGFRRPDSERDRFVQRVEAHVAGERKKLTEEGAR